MCWLDCGGLGYGQVVGFCEHGSEPSGFIKHGNYLSSGTNIVSLKALIHDVKCSTGFNV
jgi:hypothetical protein